MTEAEKINLRSMDITKEKRKQLKLLFPEVFHENVLDFDHLKRVLGEWSEVKKERYGLTWPGKAECMKIIQQPSIATLKPIREESVNFNVAENLFIEGDNLEVLKLLQKSYFGRVKMIYIDPPYNTGKEFIYTDKFGETLDNYLKYTGQKDEDGRKFSTNMETNGRYHSRWLNIMYPRLYLAKNLLREDGVIFISIDDREVSNLRALCDQIFGEENFLANIVWNSTKSVTNTALISVSHTHNLVYVKSKEYYIRNRDKFRLKETGEGFSNPDGDPKGPWKADPFQVEGWRPNQQYEITNPSTGEVYTPNTGSSWKNDFEKFQVLLSENRIVFGTNGTSAPQRKRYLSEARDRGRVAKTWWDNVGTTTNGTAELKELFGQSLFDNPKPTKLIKQMAELCTKDNDIILDFFAGSATTAHAIMALNNEDGGNRRFICVQLPEKCEERGQAFQAGYKTIADIGKERIRRAAKKIGVEYSFQQSFGFKVFKLDRSNFKVWQGNVDNFEKQLFDHIDYIDDTSSSEDILYELLLKSGLLLTDQVKKVFMAGAEVFSVNEGKLLICLDRNLTQEVINAIANANPLQVICLDAGFKGNDQLKANSSQTFKARGMDKTDHEIVFRTV